MSIAGRKTIAIVAFDEEMAIGKDGTLAWHYPEDMKRFAALTKGHSVLMGKTTYFSIPEKFRPLKERINIVLSKSEKEISGALAFDSVESLEQSLHQGEIFLPTDTIWVIGGASIYSLTKDLWDEIEVTRIPGRHGGDTFFPEFRDDFMIASTESSGPLTFERWIRKS